MANPLQGETGQSKADDVREAERLVNDLIDHTPVMQERERDFIEQMTQRFDDYGERTFVSPRQRFWLRSLRDRHILGF